MRAPVDEGAREAEGGGAPLAPARQQVGVRHERERPPLRTAATRALVEGHGGCAPARTEMANQDV